MRRAAAFLCLAMAASMQPQTVPLHKLLSTCIDAAGRGCDRIRRVQESGATDATLKIEGDAKSALTAADLAAQAAVVGALSKAWPGLTIVGEEDEAALDEDHELATPLDDALAVDFARMLKDVTPTGDLPPTQHTPGQNLKATKKKKSNTRLRARRGRVQ